MPKKNRKRKHKHDPRDFRTPPDHSRKPKAPSPNDIHTPPDHGRPETPATPNDMQTPLDYGGGMSSLESSSDNGSTTSGTVKS